MALSRHLAKSTACWSCQQWIWQSFIRSIGECSAAQPRRLNSTIRPFSVNAPRTTASQPHDDFVLNQINEEYSERQSPFSARREKNSDSTAEREKSTTAIRNTLTPKTPSSDLPWYLQVQQDERPGSLSDQPNPLRARQSVPDLPVHAPTLMQPLLEHISIDLGLDDLSILDLRAIDPPPALGANLLMVVGTARSEKHLHVSADRLCRWLRTEHKLRPHADGLLGRNELKIQMRRKAKRTRLLSSAIGAKETGEGEVEDGLRTGWVCVNVGRVPGGDLPETTDRLQRAEGIVGFGAKISGYSNIVVQMLTEEKRGEVDLEKLWTGILRRAQRENERYQRQEDEAESDRATEEVKGSV